MDVREKLVELIGSTEYGNGSLVGNNFQKGFIEKIASHLIDHGVTVQEWIPVTERLPDKDGDYLVFKRFTRNAWSDVVSFAKDGRKAIECDFGEKWQNVWYYYDNEWSYIRTDAVTHWMPLPQPPKGE